MVRSFRYVATLTAQRVVTSLVTATLLLGEARETAQRQLSAEKAKKGSKVCGRTLGLCHCPQHKHRIADVSPSKSGCQRSLSSNAAGWSRPSCSSVSTRVSGDKGSACPNWCFTDATS